MTLLNQKYFKEISKKYEIENIKKVEREFTLYRISLDKNKIVYLVLCNNYTSSSEVNLILDEISSLEKNIKTGNIYLCIMPLENPSIELCTYFNGKNFVHFIFYDKYKNNLVYDKNIYYAGCKMVKQLIDIYQNCFNELNQNNI